MTSETTALIEHQVQATLIVKDAKGERKFTLKPAKPLTCGRSRFCDITVKGSNVDRKHLHFFYRQGVFMVEAIGKQPVVINEKKKLASALHDGDVVQLGMSEILFYQVQLDKDLPERLIDHQEEDSTSETLERIRLQLSQTDLMPLERAHTKIEGIYDTGEVFELNKESVTWAIDPPDHIIINEANELVPMKAGRASVKVSCGPFFDVVDVRIRDLPLEEIEIIVPDEPLYEGERVQLQALGRFRDNKGNLNERSVTHLVEWDLSDKTLASFDEEKVGYLTALKLGRLKISAIYGDIKSHHVLIHIGGAILKELKISLDSLTIEAGSQLPVVVQGVNSNGLIQAYQEEVFWEIEGDPCVRIQGNILEALAPGHCHLKAYTAFLESNVLDLVINVTQIRDATLILPDEIAPQNRVCPMLRVLSTNGHTYDASPLAQFHVDNKSVIEILDDGNIEALKEGYATLSAHFLNQDYVKSVLVTAHPKKSAAGDVEEIIAKPLDEEIPVGLSTRIVVTGVDAQSNQIEIPHDKVIFQVKTPEVLRVSENGVVGLKYGEGVVNVSYGSLSTTVTLKVVRAKIVKIKFDPPEPTCLVGETLPLKAFALYSDGHEVDITHKASWKIPRELIGTPKGNGLEPVVGGDFSIECCYVDFNKTVTLNALVDRLEQVKEEDPRQYDDLMLKKVIGVGGMGRVFLAQRTSDHKAFALKVVRSRFLKDKSVTESFIKEAKLLSQFNHENIVRVFRYGKKGKQPYMVMEYLEGDTFSHLIKKNGPLSFAQTVAVLRDVARALHVLHNHQPHIVHRDVKPGNIFLTKQGMVKLMDFGITRAEDENETTRHTGFASKVLGTASYVSPEHVRSPKKVDVRSDLYSLGATFYTLLSGKPPFFGDNGLDIVLQHLNDIPPKLSTRIDGIPKVLDNFVIQLLAKDPKDRPQSAAEVILTLELMSESVDLRDCFF